MLGAQTQGRANKPGLSLLQGATCEESGSPGKSRKYEPSEAWGSQQKGRCALGQDGTGYCTRPESRRVQ